MNIPLVIFCSRSVCFLPLGDWDLAFDRKCDTIRTWHSERGGIAANLDTQVMSASTNLQCRIIGDIDSYVPFARDTSASSCSHVSFAFIRGVVQYRLRAAEVLGLDS
jgi:hypothetical protein